MNLRALQSLCEIVDHDLKITEAADALRRSQPSISRQIQEIERELGVSIFERQRNRLLRLTPEGERIVIIARRILREQEDLHRVSSEATKADEGPLVVATTHTQARYTLPRVVREFMQRYPKVSLSLRQGSPAQCHALVAAGRADIAICTEVAHPSEEVVFLPCFKLRRSVIIPADHPLEHVLPLTLEEVASYPIITYDEGFSGRGVVDKAFRDKGLTYRVVMSAVDADVSKSYVEFGLGIAILASIAFDARDSGLIRLDAQHLFDPSTLGIVVRRRAYLRGFTQEFVRLFAPTLRRLDIEQALIGDVQRLRRLELPEI